MPDMRGHLKLSKAVMNSLGMESLGLKIQKYIDWDPSLPQHRDWDHRTEKFVFSKDAQELAEWVIHLAVDYDLIPEWISIVQGKNVMYGKIKSMKSQAQKKEKESSAKKENQE